MTPVGEVIITVPGPGPYRWLTGSLFKAADARTGEPLPAVGMIMTVVPGRDVTVELTTVSPDTSLPRAVRERTAVYRVTDLRME